MAASEFVVGENRFPFGLVSVDGEFLEDAVVDVRFYSLEQEEPQLRAEASATWRVIGGEDEGHEHAEGVEHLHIRGAYVVDEVQFDQPGFWMAEFDIATPSGPQLQTQAAAFEVKEESTAPGLGEAVPATNNLTIHDVDSFADLSTRPVEDDMHNVSVAEALESELPFLVVFSSPQFCQTAICGPVTDEVASVHEQFKDRMEFIHIEPWDLEIARGEGRLERGDAMVEWGLPTEPWTFVIDSEGRVANRFEGLVTAPELAPAVEAVLAP
ncbi:MAG: hypothetical protein WD645_02065, partial [Dehalococcoidia bacterium]